MTKFNLAAIILTFNEELHIDRCIRSISNVVDKIYVMDSFSTDETLNLLKKYNNVEIKQNKFVNHASQFNHALDSFQIKSKWILRIDADEYINPELEDYLLTNLKNISEKVNGISLNREMCFLDKKLKYGGMANYWHIRIFKNGFGICEQTWMDEHIVISSGECIKAKGSIIDHNLNSLSWWSEKHVNYATREAIDIILRESGSQTDSVKTNFFGNNTERTRYLKKLYTKTPLFIRPFLLFIYRYIFLLGFLDGRQGLIWNILETFWYRFLVDSKLYEIKSQINNDEDVSHVIKRIYGYTIHK